MLSPHAHKLPGVVSSAAREMTKGWDGRGGEGRGGLIKGVWTEYGHPDLHGKGPVRPLTNHCMPTASPKAGRLGCYNDWLWLCYVVKLAKHKTTTRTTATRPPLHFFLRWSTNDLCHKSHSKTSSPNFALLPLILADRSAYQLGSRSALPTNNISLLVKLYLIHRAV